MRIEPLGRGVDEPEDGWISAPLQVIDTEVLTVVLCKFTGGRLPVDAPCSVRGKAHPDVECHTLFVQADALRGGEIVTEEFPEAQSEIRVPFRAGEVVGVVPPELP